MKHFAIVDDNTNIVVAVISTESDVFESEIGFTPISIPEHDAYLLGKKYENGEFIDVEIEE